MKCNQCNQEYAATRSDSLYCSVTCRVTAKRNKAKNVTDKDVTANKEAIDVTDDVTDRLSVTPMPVQPVAPPLLHRAVVPGPLDLNAIKHPFDLRAMPVQRVPAPGHDPCMTATEVMTRMACAPHDPLHETNCQARGVNTCNTGPYKPAHELGQREVNRVSLPGDADYSGTW